MLHHDLDIRAIARLGAVRFGGFETREVHLVHGIVLISTVGGVAGLENLSFGQTVFVGLLDRVSERALAAHPAKAINSK